MKADFHRANANGTMYAFCVRETCWFYFPSRIRGGRSLIFARFICDFLSHQILNLNITKSISYRNIQPKRCGGRVPVMKNH